MKTTIKVLVILLISGVVLFSSCSKSDDTPTDPTSTVSVVNKVTVANGFSYKIFYQETANSSTRKGIVILAHGDFSDSNDGTLNDQCAALAQNGYVAVTTSYRTPVANYNTAYNNFKVDMESVINQVTADYAIPVNKTILGGLSRGGNLAFNMFLPANAGAPIQPTALNLKGAALECSGGDNWKGSAILKPVIYMSNKVDNEVGADALAFQTGLNANLNPNVKTTSECLIIDATGHCTNADQYKPFLVRKVKEWL